MLNVNLRKWLLASALTISLAHGASAQGLIDDVAGGGSQGMSDGSDGQSELVSPELDLRSKQSLLYDADHEKEEDQVGKGIKEVVYDPDEAPFIHVRNFGGTTIFLPNWESIEEIYVGDPSVFTADYPKDANKRITRRNVIKVAVNRGRTGADTPLTLLGSNGSRQYKFILSSYNHNTNELIPDFWVTVVDPAQETVVGLDPFALPGSTGPSNSVVETARGTGPGFENGGETSSAPKRKQQDEKPEWLREIEFDPSKIRTDDYVVEIQTESAREIAPDAVWHDGFFTYLKYNEDRSDIIQRPAVQTVIDDYNSPVTTETVGPKTNIIVVRSIGRNLFLGNGQKIVCIIWKGNNTRVSG